VARFDAKLQPPHFAAGDPSDIDFVRKLLARPRPDAVICSDDLTAALLMQTVTGPLGLSLPQELALAGFDNVNYSTLLSVPLTTMRQPCRAIAHAAVNRLLARIEDPKLPPCQMMFNAELVVRRSCGASDKQA
jgi:LacI family transcriptional regulator